jgi:NAD-dependent deacetylase
MSIPAQCARVAEWLHESECNVAFTGAGISTESGIPDFRSPGGIWEKVQPVYFQDYIASAEARHEYWRQKCSGYREHSCAQPNAAHQALAKWESNGKLLGVITQNIDGLHQLAGSRRVWELHGTARQVMCLDCEARFDTEPFALDFLENSRVPDCPECGGMLKHATVSFGQNLPEDVITAARETATWAKVFLVLGSSLVVYPAAMLPEVAKHHGARLVIINREATLLDEIADEVIHASLGETLSAIDALLSPPNDASAS